MHTKKRKKKKMPLSSPECPVCKVEMRLIEHRDTGRAFWGCRNYPECDVTISAHAGTLEPMGDPAPKKVREWRIKAHKALDALWDGVDGLSRDEVYDWLSSKMRLGKRAHIASMDVGQCRKVIGLCELTPPKRKTK